jgi:hypothetical protein
VNGEPASPAARALLAAACEASGLDPTPVLARLVSADLATCVIVAAVIRRAGRTRTSHPNCTRSAPGCAPAPRTRTAPRCRAAEVHPS